ncbi:reverse transcriptase domain-containing protein [Tanacetum coccineum]
MSTRSSSSNLIPPFFDPESVIRNRRRNLGDPSLLLDFEEINMSNNLNINPGPPHAGPPPQNHNGPPGPNLHIPAPDLQTMEELCHPTINGRGRPITPLNIQATDFGLKNHMIQQVQISCQFHGLPGDDANKHLDKFLTITHSMKQNGVTDDALRLYLFPYSLTHHATAWFDRLSKNSIHTFQEMASKFHFKYFPPSMVMKLRNDISNFRQLPDESLFKAWERYKLSIDQCPNHNICETCGGPHSYYECQAVGGYTQDVYATTGNYNSGGHAYQPQGDPLPNVPSLEEMMLQHMRSTEAKIQQMQTYNTQQIQHLQTQNTQMANLMGQVQKALQERPQGALPSNTIPNPREEIKAITTRSGNVLAGPSVPHPPLSSSFKEVERDSEMIKDQQAYWLLSFCRDMAEDVSDWV